MTDLFRLKFAGLKHSQISSREIALCTTDIVPDSVTSPKGTKIIAQGKAASAATLGHDVEF